MKNLKKKKLCLKSKIKKNHEKIDGKNGTKNSQEKN